jgi:hypothetical protein
MAIRFSDCRIANDPTSAQENVSQFATTPCRGLSLSH